MAEAEDAAMEAEEGYAEWAELRRQFFADRTAQQAEAGSARTDLKCFNTDIRPRFAFGKLDLRKLTVDQAKENLRSLRKSGRIAKEDRPAELARHKAFLREYWKQHPEILTEKFKPRARPNREKQ